MRKLFLLLPLVALCSFLKGFGQSLRYNGSNNYVNLGSEQALRLQNFTIEAWINIQGTGGTTGTSIGNEGGFKASTVVPLITKGRREKGSTAAAINYFFGYRATDRKLVADFEDNATGAHHTIVGAATLATSTWIHVAVSYGSNTWRLYINGAIDQTNILTGNFTPQSLSTVSAAIGASLNSNSSAEGFFNGMIDEVRIWNIVRSQPEISANYKAELTSGTGLVARYGFNEGSGTTASNST